MEEKRFLPTASTTTSPRLCRNAPDPSCRPDPGIARWPGGRSGEAAKGPAPPPLDKASEQTGRSGQRHSPQAERAGPLAPLQPSVPPENAAPGGQITVRLLPSLPPSSSAPQERSLETCSLQAPRGTKTDPDRRFPEHMQHGYADLCRPAALLLHLHKEREWLDLSLS